MMKYAAIILSIVLISLSYIIYESESTYAMRTVTSNWNYNWNEPHSFEVKETKKEANYISRASKAESFVPTFKIDYDFYKTYHEIPNRYNHGR